MGSMRSTSSTGYLRTPGRGEGGLVSFMNTALLEARATATGKIVKATAFPVIDSEQGLTYPIHLQV